MRLKSLFTISVFLSTILALLSLSSFVDSKTPVQAAASDPAKLFVIVQNGAGTRITNATVTLTVGKVVSPQWCNYAGKNGTWTATKVLWNGLTEYWYYQSSGVVLQICCNASSFTLSVSAPGYISKTLKVVLTHRIYLPSRLSVLVGIAPSIHPRRPGAVQELMLFHSSLIVTG